MGGECQEDGEISALGSLKLSFMRDRNFIPGKMYYLELTPVDAIMQHDPPPVATQGHPDGFIDPEQSL